MSVYLGDKLIASGASAQSSANTNLMQLLYVCLEDSGADRIYWRKNKTLEVGDILYESSVSEQNTTIDTLTPEYKITNIQQDTSTEIIVDVVGVEDSSDTDTFNFEPRHDYDIYAASDGVVPTQKAVKSYVDAKIQVVNALPASPNDNIFYFVKG